jgi:hypothetical protein
MTEQQQRELAAGLKALAESTRDQGAGPHVRQHVQHARLRLPQRQGAASYGEVSPERAQEFRARVGGSHVARPHVWLPLAASLLLATASAVWVAQSSAPPPPPVEPAGFVALPEAERLPMMESANIVRVSLPVAALPAYGVAVADLQTESVEAELLVAQDGQARAIRLVNSFTNSRSANNE